MDKKEYLNEEKYQQVKGKISVVAFIVLIVGLVIGGMLIVKGIQSTSDTVKTSVIEKLQQEEVLLKSKKSALEAKGIKYSVFSKYSDGEAYDLMIITNVMDPSFSYWKFDEYKNNSLTKNYCLLKAQLEEANDGFNSIPYFMFGGFIIIATCIISGSIYMITKRREIAAFSAQQMRPIVEEGIEKMAPSVGNAAKEIAKGIKDGLKDEEK